jgi:hypothetical protein
MQIVCWTTTVCDCSVLLLNSSKYLQSKMANRRQAFIIHITKWMNQKATSLTSLAFV